MTEEKELSYLRQEQASLHQETVGNERSQYDAYGNLLHAPVTSLLQTNPWRFASSYFDSATSFTRFGVCSLKRG